MMRGLLCSGSVAFLCVSASAGPLPAPIEEKDFAVAHYDLRVDSAASTSAGELHLSVPALDAAVPAAVPAPEPKTFLLIGGGLLALGLLGIRRTKRAD